MSIILGIDPGSRITGYGIIEFKNNHFTHIVSGCLQLGNKEQPERLQKIFAGIQEIIVEYQPNEAAIEQVFMHQNAGGAIKLGQARGAAIVAMTQHGLSVAEYSARQIKQATAGYGAADKQQMQHMVRILLNLQQSPVADAADALAVAICHANTQQGLNRLGTGKLISHGRIK